MTRGVREARVGCSCFAQCSHDGRVASKPCFQATQQMHDHVAAWRATGASSPWLGRYLGVTRAAQHWCVSSRRTNTSESWESLAAESGRMKGRKAHVAVGLATWSVPVHAIECSRCHEGAFHCSPFRTAQRHGTNSSLLRCTVLAELELWSVNRMPRHTRREGPVLLSKVCARVTRELRAMMYTK